MQNLQSLQKKITDQYQQIWLTEIKRNNKLETYVLLKNEFIKENYIDILKEKHLKAMSRLRTSCHPLKIENPLCSVCNVIEDEEHFLVSCKKYEAEIKFVKHIVTVCVFVCHLFSFYPFYFDFHSTRIIFDVSSGFYLWNVNRTTMWHLKKC